MDWLVAPPLLIGASVAGARVGFSVEGAKEMLGWKEGAIVGVKEGVLVTV